MSGSHPERETLIYWLQYRVNLRLILAHYLSPITNRERLVDKEDGQLVRERH